MCLARALVVTLALAGAGAVMSLAARAVALDGFTWIDGATLALLTLPTFWIGWQFGHATLGFIGRRIGWRPVGLADHDPQAPIHTRTALVLPVYDEEPAEWGANLLAMGEELVALGHAEAFDLVVLSDSRDDEVADREARMRDRLAHALPMAVRYRRRLENTGKKAGNIADFVRRMAGPYDFMLILDADSLMSGRTILHLVRSMQANPGAGLIQTTPRLARRHSLFARLQQFAAGLMGPVAGTGQALWQGGDGNFWGHNAIVRCSAWNACVHLPRLKGPVPFGGHILSHDFVEAALLRRGGWGVWMLPHLEGSWEETPPGLLDHLGRDRRWCQGNLQHLRVMFWPRLHPISRLHLLLGLTSFAIAPLWLALVIGATLMSLTGRLHFDPFLASGALLASGTMLFTPKLLAVLDTLLDARRRRGMGGAGGVVLSAVLETVLSVFLAPSVLAFHARFLAELLGGRDGGWARQRRSEAMPALRELYAWCRVHLGGAVILATLAVLTVPEGWVVWLLLPAVGWASVPLIAWATAHPRVAGRSFVLFATPEETEGNPTIRRADILSRALRTAAAPAMAPAAAMSPAHSVA